MRHLGNPYKKSDLSRRRAHFKVPRDLKSHPRMMSGLATMAARHFCPRRGYKRSLCSSPWAGIVLLDPQHSAGGLDQTFLCFPMRPRGALQAWAPGRPRPSLPPPHFPACLFASQALQRSDITERWYRVLVPRVGSKAHHLGSNPGTCWPGNQHSDKSPALPKSSRTRVVGNEECRSQKGPEAMLESPDVTVLGNHLKI